ncbi:MAG: glutaredoxin 3 [Rhodospirillaceae bacterium]|nr:glutaredoxin 3 [Rhodospirillaceae bacterium]MBT7956507.1 glutaredoxin 3 [Rhodospirillaceae bacterium]
MAKVEIYTSPFCGFCYRAKGLLENKGVDFDEIDITFHPSRHSEMLGRANGQRTVPQIFVDDKHVGGCDDLYALDSRGELDTILS